MAMPEPMEFDPQDQAETFDEETLGETEMRTFDEMEDVFDVTSRLGDGRDIGAVDEADFQAGDIDDEDLEEDEDIDDRVRDELEDAPENDDPGSDDLDERDGVTRLAGDESELEYVADVDTVTDPDDDDVDKYESRQVSDEELSHLGYQTQSSEPRTEREEKPSQGSGASADDVPDEAHPHQDELLDEGVEETFPASDPVSVKRIT